MPQLIPAALAAISTFAATAIGQALISYAISYVVNKIFAPKPRGAESIRDAGVQARLPADPGNKLPIVYGTKRIAGSMIMADIKSDNQSMAFIIALSEGPVDSIDKVFWADKELSFGSDLSSTLQNVTNATDGDDVTHPFLNDGRMKVAVFTGGSNNTCPLMATFSSKWNSDTDNRTLSGIAYAYIELTYDRDQQVTGLPSNLQFRVKGRLTKTIGSDNTLSTTESHSDNPADILLEYLTNTRYGGNIPLKAIDIESFKKHRDFCNEMLPYVANDSNKTTLKVATAAGSAVTTITVANASAFAASGTVFLKNGQTFVYSSKTDNTSNWTLTGTSKDLGVNLIDTEVSEAAFAKRYTSNGVVNTNEDIDRNVSNLTIGSSVDFNWNLGKFALITEEAKSSIFSFSPDNISGGIEIQGQGFTSKLNKLTLKYSSIQDLEKENQVILETPASAKNPEEPVLENTWDLPFTISNIEAERVGAILLNQSRQSLITTFSTDLSAYGVQAGDIISITHYTPSWTDKEFRVLSVEEVIQGGFISLKIVAQEYADAVYDDRMINEYDPASNTNFPNPFITPVVTSVSATEDTDIDEPNLTLTWADSTSIFNNYYTIGYRFNAQPLADLKYKTVSNAKSYVLTGLEASSTYYVEISPSSINGVTGTAVSTTGTTATARVIGAPSVTTLIQPTSGSPSMSNNTGSVTIKAFLLLGGTKQPDEGETNSIINSYKWKYTQSGGTSSTTITNGTVDAITGTTSNTSTGTDSEDFDNHSIIIEADGTALGTTASGGAVFECEIDYT